MLLFPPQVTAGRQLQEQGQAQHQHGPFVKADVPNDLLETAEAELCNEAAGVLREPVLDYALSLYCLSGCPGHHDTERWESGPVTMLHSRSSLFADGFLSVSKFLHIVR